MTNRELTCKSFAIRGVNGNYLRLSETMRRDEIVISIEENNANGLIATVRIDAEAFAALCNMNSAYDGLEIVKSKTPESALVEAGEQS
jgi:hypothetical protein